MAEWLGRGLQNLVQRFESASDLKASLKRGAFFVAAMEQCSIAEKQSVFIGASPIPTLRFSALLCSFAATLFAHYSPFGAVTSVVYLRTA